ncbi:MAG: hypothetical protein Q9M28_05595 [Mariprofundaceae bacterium]|nr:hypothetical protein [Mariprofundaceae bacterium]
MFIISAFFSYFQLNPAAPLQPFQSDGCSLFPDGSWSKPEAWSHCCLNHDLAYWQGGTAPQRQQADEELATCVQQAGFPVTATMMHMGVRIGGSPFLPTWYRWGYGWSYGRAYQALSTLEKERRDHLSEPTKNTSVIPTQL